MALQKSQEIRVVIFKGVNHWVAQCLEFDIAAQAESLDDLPVRLSRTLLAELEISKHRGSQPFESLDKAPARYWQMWEHARAEDASSWKSLLPGFISDCQTRNAAVA